MQDKTGAILGIDVSHFNTVDSWQKVKDSGVRFVYLKGSEGNTYTDPTAGTFFAGARSVGLDVGLYHFARPSDNLDDAVKEAQLLKSVMAKYGVTLKPVLDLEATVPGIDEVAWVRKFIKEMGCEVILYTGLWFLQQEGIKGLSDLPLWVSYYKDTPPPNYDQWSKWTMWQYSDGGSIAGIGGAVDMDVAMNINDLLINPLPKPGDQAYTLVAGDSLWRVANAVGLTVDQLKAINGITSDVVNVGQTLLLKTAISATAGSGIVTKVNGNEFPGVIVVDGVSFAPLRNFAQALGASASWDGTNFVINVKN